MIMIALAAMLLVGATDEASARVYAIGKLTPDVLLDGDPDYPYIASPGEPKSVSGGDTAARAPSVDERANPARLSPLRGWTWLRDLMWRWTWLRY